MQSGHVIVSAPDKVTIDRRAIREIRGSVWGRPDRRFIGIVFVSILIHLVLLYFLSTQKMSAPEPKALEQISSRFAKLIIEKPLPKKNARTAESLTSSETVQTTSKRPPSDRPVSRAALRQAAKRAMKQHTQTVEKKIRNVGVLGVLSGKGKNTVSPPVVDILGAIQSGDNNFRNFDKALSTIKGLHKGGVADDLDTELSRSKTFESRTDLSIDHLVAQLGNVDVGRFEKKGTFIIEPVKTIKGTQTATRLRDKQSIHKVVLAHKDAIYSLYLKHLDRNPLLKGKITVQITIQAAGSVSKVQVTENSFDTTDLADKIIQLIKTWQFPSVSKGEVTVTYPFLFQPS